MVSFKNGLLILLTVPAMFFLSSCSNPTQDKTSPSAAAINAPLEVERILVDTAQPAKINPSELKPGLDAVYYTNYFKRDVKGLPHGKNPDYPRFKRGPILELNHSFGRGKVFESGTNRGVGIRMKGFIHFDTEGVYELQAISNDGILLYLDEQLVLSDPGQHSDRPSNVGVVTVNKPGWYATTIEYFQRKGTATLKLLWKKPGENEQQPLPQSAYRHQKGLE